MLKKRRYAFRSFLIEKFKNRGSSTFKKIVTGDEVWLYKYDPETKQQIMKWSVGGANTSFKANQKKTAAKVMISVYFTKRKNLALLLSKLIRR